MVDMLKKLGKKGIIGIAVGAVVLVVIIALILILVLRIDGAEAQNIALERVPGATAQDMSIELDYDDGWYIYEGDILYNRTEYEFEIDANTGNILKWEEERW